MTDAELSKAIKKYLIPLIGSEYSIKANILYKTPVTDILLGFCFERSANDKNGFYLWAFAQPLYVPAEDFNLTFGTRLKRRKLKSERWEVSNDIFEELADVVKIDGLKYLENVSDPKKFCQFFKSDKSGSIRVLEAIVYSEFYCDMSEANSDVMLLIKHLRKKENLSIGWVMGILKNTERLLEAKKNSKDAIRSILDEWKRNSIMNLGV